MMTVRRVVLEYNVPKSTLHNKWVKPSATLEPFHYLDDGEEDKTAHWIIGWAEVRYAKSVNEV